MKRNFRRTMLAALSFAVLLAGLASAAQAEPCQAQGSLHLVKPITTFYCQQNGQILWAVTYAPESQFVIVANTTLNNLWYFPLTLNSTQNSTSRVKHFEKTASTSFTLKTGSANNGWVHLSLKGN